MATKSPQMTSHKARYGGGITGCVTAAMMLVFHYAGLIQLGEGDLAAIAMAIGSGAGTGVVALLGIYGSPANKHKE